MDKNIDRNMRIIALRKEGFTLREIGEKVGMSYQNVSSILKKPFTDTKNNVAVCVFIPKDFLGVQDASVTHDGITYKVYVMMEKGPQVT